MDTTTTRRTIAVLTDAFAPFHRLVLDGLEPHISRAGYGTLCMTGRDVSWERFQPQGEASIEQIRPAGARRNVAGAIIVSGAIPPSATEEQISRFVSNLTDGPVVSLGARLAGVASVTIRWQEAIDELVAHMTADPHRRRFVFLRGYADDPHSTQRERGFRSGMAKAGLTVDEDLIITGHYNAADATNAVDELLQAGHRFDGLIAANDDMASGAIAALTRHGIVVPRDVIVSGFDDALVAFTSVPPLTTARLDTPELARVSAGVVLDALAEGVDAPADLLLEIESRVIVRKSSRSQVAESNGAPRLAPGATTKHITDELLERWEPDHAPAGLDVHALAASIAETATTGSDACARMVRSLIDAPIAPDMLRDGQVWARHAVRAVRSVLVAADARDVVTYGRRAVEEQLVVFDRALRPLEHRTLTESRSERALQERLLMNIASCSDRRALWQTLRSGLRALGMKRAWVAIDDDGGDGDTMRLVFSLDSDPIALNVRFEATAILPSAYAATLESSMHVLVPLRAGSNEIGYLISEPTNDHLMELEALASGIAQVLRHVRQVEDLEERALQLRDANAKLDLLARRDPLTGLPNRKLFFETLNSELTERADDDEVAVLLFDLDGFKAVNDTLGHDAGDRLLRVIAHRVTDLLREDDMFARLGGDEFTIVLRQPAGSDRAVRVANDVLAAIAVPCPLTAGTVHVTASVGIAVAPTHGTETRALVHRADTAMYASKASGRNRSTNFVSDRRRAIPSPA